MHSVQFTKKCNVGELHKELVAAGFQVIGVTYDEGTNVTIVQLADGETKDPTAVVTAHVYTEPVIVPLEEEFANATTSDEKITVLARALGLNV